MLWVFVSFLLLYLGFYSGSFTSSDEVAVFEMTRSLAERGDLSVPEIVHTGIGADGRTRHSFFAPGQSFLALPFFGLSQIAGGLLPGSWLETLGGPPLFAARAARLGGTSAIAITGFYGPAASALLVALFFGCQRRLGVSGRNAALATLALGAGTYVASLSGYFLRHATESILILSAVLALRSWALTDRRRFLWLASLCASSVILVRLPSAVFGLGFAAALLAAMVGRRGRPGNARLLPGDLVAVGAPLLVVLGLHVGLNELRWGHPFESPMTAQQAILDNPIWNGITGLLFSPGAGMLWYSPILCLSPVLLWAARKKEPLLVATIVAVFVPMLLFVASYRHWPGLWSAPGPRYLYSCIPLLLLPLGLWLDGGPRRGLIKLTAILALAGSVVQGTLLLAPWGVTVSQMGYAALGSEGPFLWSLSEGPVMGSFRTVWVHGDLSPLLLRIASGWPSQPAAPALAAWLGAAWAALVVLSLRRAWGLAAGLDATAATRPARVPVGDSPSR